ncbi:putative lipoprotein YiaD [invertebrate metagenome]|uniref:Putative lipoprotein YiaD n=1 Tax=invertebrate metagenome TaxID=1711999 RepID=A0A2H9TCA3_9ZZZZ
MTTIKSVRLIPSFVIICLAVLIAGCQTTDPYTGEAQVNKTSKYGGIGAVTGAIIGGLVDGKDGALKGAALGGAAGAGYGYYTDRQESALRSKLQGTGVQVHRQGDILTLVMPSNITFDSSKSDIKSGFYPVLDSVARIFKEYNKNLVQVVGYTDSTGGDKINLPLSQSRANSVADYLKSQSVSYTRISAIGRGAQNPIATNKTPEGRAINRRVEINLLPKPQA